ncbi:hypothetical protein KJ807_05605 [Patescibacteria group bacterium]|nr:hypothetical protein [Patescibacteria group bacterium]
MEKYARMSLDEIDCVDAAEKMHDLLDVSAEPRRHSPVPALGLVRPEQAAFAATCPGAPARRSRPRLWCDETLDVRAMLAEALGLSPPRSPVPPKIVPLTPPPASPGVLVICEDTPPPRRPMSAPPPPPPRPLPPPPPSPPLLAYPEPLVPFAQRRCRPVRPAPVRVRSTLGSVHSSTAALLAGAIRASQTKLPSDRGLARVQKASVAIERRARLLRPFLQQHADDILDHAIQTLGVPIEYIDQATVKCLREEVLCAIACGLF